jgi:hypothetical protein
MVRVRVMVMATSMLICLKGSNGIGLNCSHLMSVTLCRSMYAHQCALIIVEEHR